MALVRWRMWIACALFGMAAGSAASCGRGAKPGASSETDGGAILRDGGQDSAADAGSMHADAGLAQDAGVVETDAGTDAGTRRTPMLLYAANGRLTNAEGDPIDFRGAISCCGGGFGWPLFDEAWVDYVASHEVNFLHVRLGPFLTGAGGETDWAAVGGAYAETHGKADLTRWNDAFWSRVRALIARARERGLYVEVDVADGWAIKHCRFGDIPGYSAWDAAFNVQGEDSCGTAGSAAIAPSSVHERWVRKVIAETGGFDNVIYQDGNEIGLVPGYRAAWTRSMERIIRDEENARGFPRHLFGTQSQKSDAMAATEVDYLEFHGAPRDSSTCLGKPCLVNEYNPNPPLPPEDLHDRYCTARDQGTYYWYWRHGQDAEQMDRTLSLIARGCP